MTLLGLDFGSSSVKAGILRDGKTVGKVVRAGYQTHFDGIRAEINSDDVLSALAGVIRQLGQRAKKVDAIAIDVMAPSWIAMDKRGRALTPIITHQDRRAVDEAHRLVKELGKARLLKISGNLPFPGGISSTTWAWFARHQRSVLNKADLVGHLSTFLHRHLTGARVTDPSNASFMGVYQTLTLAGWSDELCDAAGAKKSLLPEILESDEIAGRMMRESAKRFGLTDGTPILAGMIDTSAALLLRGMKVGQLLNVCGSTDVLALCTDKPRPDEQLLTRAVGIGKRWLQVNTLAAAGSMMAWANHQLFPELTENRFHVLVDRLAKKKAASTVKFEPYLAGERTSIDQKSAAFTGLNLSTTREQMLSAVVEALAEASAARIALLKKTGTPMKRAVLESGGLAKPLGAVLHRDWPGRWSFHFEDEATLRGLAKIVPRER